jgi:hypothetical protein
MAEPTYQSLANKLNLPYKEGDEVSVVDGNTIRIGQTSISGPSVGAHYEKWLTGAFEGNAPSDPENVAMWEKLSAGDPTQPQPEQKNILNPGGVQQKSTAQDPNPSPTPGVFDPGFGEKADPTPGFAPGTNPNINYLPEGQDRRSSGGGSQQQNQQQAQFNEGEFVNFQTPGGAVLGVFEGGQFRTPTTQEILANPLANAKTIQSSTDTPYQEFAGSMSPQKMATAAGAQYGSSVGVTSSPAYDFGAFANKVMGGIQALASASPVSIQQLYGNIYGDLGLNTIKVQIDDVQKQLQAMDQERADKISDVNDNPWFTEGKRVGEIRKLDERYDLKRAALAGSLQLYQSIWESGVSEARFLATATLNQYNAERSFQIDMLESQFSIAEKIYSAQATAQQREFENQFAVDSEMARRFESDRGFEFDIAKQEFQNQLALEKFELDRQNVYSQISNRGSSGPDGSTPGSTPTPVSPTANLSSFDPDAVRDAKYMESIGQSRDSALQVLKRGIQSKVFDLTNQEAEQLINSVYSGGQQTQQSLSSPAIVEAPDGTKININSVEGIKLLHNKYGYPAGEIKVYLTKDLKFSVTTADQLLKDAGLLSSGSSGSSGGMSDEEFLKLLSQ